MEDHEGAPDSGQERWFWVGSRPEAEAALVDTFGCSPVRDVDVAAAAAGDVVVLDPAAPSELQQKLPHGHVFSAVPVLKQRGAKVYVIVDAEDELAIQIARFVLVDAVLIWHSTTGELDAHEVGGRGRSGPARPSVDDLLSRLQRDAGESGQENSLQRLMRFEREDGLLTQLQDPETGLFDGPYATLKLDEEWKRSHRFHQPLSLLLLDLGFPDATSEADRRAALAEAAGVFLNISRDIDVLARFSQDVFLFLLPGTGPDGAQVLSERIVAGLRERLQGPFSATPAGGLATVPSAQIRDRKRFVAVAEGCLERAREQVAANGEPGVATGGVCTSWQ
ncbi:MAG: diguanylate cyclase [Planctomycetota bacterium]